MAKALRDHSMSEKHETPEIIKGTVVRDPVDTVKSKLTEPKRPSCKTNRRDTMIYVPAGLNIPTCRKGMSLKGSLDSLDEAIHDREGRVIDHEGRGMGTYTDLNVIEERKARSSKGREPYDDGAPIVVRVRESRTHGEVGQGSSDAATAEDA